MLMHLIGARPAYVEFGPAAGSILSALPHPAPTSGIREQPAAGSGAADRLVPLLRRHSGSVFRALPDGRKSALVPGRY